MFARSSTIHAQPAKIDAGIAHVRDTVMPAMSHIEGFVGLSLMVDRETGTCIATSAWRSEQAMRDSAARVGSIRDEADEIFGGNAAVEEWAVEIMHRAHHSRPGTAMRVTWSRTDPARADEVLDMFKFSTLPRIEDMPGFCSASVLVNRAEGRAVTTVAFDSREALESTREQGAAVREDSARETKVEIVEVREFELAVAHLHVPEMV